MSEGHYPYNVTIGATKKLSTAPYETHDIHREFTLRYDDAPTEEKVNADVVLLNMVANLMTPLLIDQTEREVVRIRGGVGEVKITPQAPQVPQNQPVSPATPPIQPPAQPPPAPPQQPENPKKVRNYLYMMYINENPTKPEFTGVKEYLDNQEYKIYKMTEQDALNKIEELKQNFVIPK